jgi:hypothetical protein
VVTAPASSLSRSQSLQNNADELSKPEHDEQGNEILDIPIPQRKRSSSISERVKLFETDALQKQSSTGSVEEEVGTPRQKEPLLVEKERVKLALELAEHAKRESRRVEAERVKAQLAAYEKIQQEKEQLEKERLEQIERDKMHHAREKFEENLKKEKKHKKERKEKKEKKERKERREHAEKAKGKIYNRDCIRDHWRFYWRSMFLL